MPPYLDGRKVPTRKSQALSQRGNITKFVLFIAQWLASFLGFVPLPPTYWIALGLILPSYVILTQVMETWVIRRFGLS